MTKRIGAHVRGNLVGYLALFVAFGSGSAWAVNGPLAGKNTVNSAAIANGQVKRADIAANAVTSAKVANGSLKRGDFARGVLAKGGGVVGPPGPAGPQGPAGPAGKGSGSSGAPSGQAGGGLAGKYPNPKIGPNAVGSAEVTDNSLTAADLGVGSVTSSEVADNTLTGADINESTLAQVPSALLGGLGRAASSQSSGTASRCTPNPNNRFLTCVDVNVVLPSRTRVLLLGRITGLPLRKSNELATCRLATNLSGGVPGGSVLFQGDLGKDLQVQGTLIGVTPPLGPGQVDITIDCVQRLVGVKSFSFQDATIVAVALSPS